jgi:acyl-CoA synthetase (AMP-forming)/AMP-acid ligase II
MSDLLSLSAVLEGHYRIRHDRVAIHLMQGKLPDQPITYGRLVQGAAGVAEQLAAAGAAHGEVVVIILPHGELLIDAFWGAVLHGAIPSILAPLTEKLSPEKYRRDLAALIGVTQPGAIVTTPEFEGEARAAVEASGRAPAVLVLREPCFVEPEWRSLGGMRAHVSDVALLQHSSGTTGLQKGVALSHRAIFNQLQAYAPAIHLSPNDVIVSWLPLYHDMGLIASFVLPVMRRVPVVIMSPFEWVRAPVKLLQTITAHKGTLCWLPNFAYPFIAARARERDLVGVDLSSMRAFVNCSEPCYRHAHAQFAARFAPYGLRPDALHTSYAMAENTFAVTQTRRAPAFDEQPGELRLSCGRPLPNVELRVLDAELRAVGEGTVGEIVVRSDCMLDGYYHRPDVTAAAFVDGFYRTGDLGYLKDGELYVTGRSKDLIIVGGKNVYPNDLEQLAGEVSGVHAGRVVAFGIFDEVQGTEEVVVVAEAEDAAVLADEAAGEELADRVRAHVTKNSDVAVRIVRIVPEKWLIKTSSGKISRTACREKWVAGK